MCTVNIAGLHVHHKVVPFQSHPAELIVIPRSHTFKFAKVLHIKLEHPLPSQFKLQFSCQYIIMDKKETLQPVYESCDYPCQASSILPKEAMKYTIETKPTTFRGFLNTDIMVEA